MFHPNINTGNLNAANAKITNLNAGNTDIQGILNVNNNLINITTADKIGIKNKEPNYTLDIVGDINYTGNLLNNGNIVQTETYSVNNLWSKSGTYVFYNGSVIVGGNIQTSYTFYVNGTSYFLSNLVCGGTITVLNLTCTNNLKTLNGSIDNLTVVKTAGFTCDINMPNNNLITKNITGQNILLTGNLDMSLGKLKCRTLEVTNFENFASTITFGQNIVVLGKSYLQGDVFINTNKFQINSATGDTIVAGGMIIGNALRVNNTLTVVNETSLNKTTINNSLTINGDLITTGNLLLNRSDVICSTNRVLRDLSSAVNFAVDGNIQSANFMIIPTNTSAPVRVNYTTASTSSTNGALVVRGGVGIGGDMNITGRVVSSNGTSTFQAIRVSDLITNTGSMVTTLDSSFQNNLQVGKNLQVIESVSCKNLVVSQVGVVPILQTVSVTTQANIVCGGNLFVSGNSTFNGILNAPGGFQTNCMIITDSTGQYKFQPSYSGYTFTILSANDLRGFSVPTPEIGLNYKILIGPNYTQPSSPNFYLIFRISPTAGPGFRLFGIIQSNSTITKIPPNTFTSIKIKNPAPGDIIDVVAAYVNNDPTPGVNNLSYHVRIQSSNLNAYEPTNQPPLPPGPVP